MGRYSVDWTILSFLGFVLLTLSELLSVRCRITLGTGN